MHPLLDTLREIKTNKKKVSFAEPKPTKKAQCRTDAFLLFDPQKNEVITKYPGEFRKFIKDIGGNYNSIMSNRSAGKNKNINIWVGKHYLYVKYILLAKSITMVNL